MKIKDLKKAEELPMKESMRKSSNYDSWDCNHVCGRGYYSWLRGFVAKNVGQPFDDVFSKFKKSLKKKRIDQKTQDEMLWYFKSIVETRRYKSYWLVDYYIDEDGILCKGQRKTKSRDVVIRYGEPETVYHFRDMYEGKVFEYLVKCFGYVKAQSMIRNGITEKEYNTETNEVRRFNNLMYENDVKPTRYAWNRLYWTDLWWGYRTYPYTETLKYRSREYYRYWYERQDATRKYARERYQELIDRFNRCEIEHNEHPFLIK